MLDKVFGLLSESLQLMVAEMDLLFRILALMLPLLLLEVVFLLGLLLIIYVFLRLLGMAAEQNKDSQRVSVGFFHPYSMAGGGGERVLWCAIKALQNRYPHVDCVVYSGDTPSSHQELQTHVADRFNLSLPRPVRFVPLTYRSLLEARLYPRFTLMLQAFGSLLVAAEAICRYRPDIFLDTMGYSFAYPLVKVMSGGNCKVACYIHYPIISTDMLNVVEERSEAHNNAGFIARSGLLSCIKSHYYQYFSRLYGWVGRKADLIMVNSSWTSGHISTIWGVEDRAKLIFPPCDITKFASLDLLTYGEKLIKKIVSIGQFRPEKNHALQLRSFKRLLELLSERGGDIDAVEVQLVIVGGVRGADDQQRVSELQDLAVQLGIDKQVEWCVNMPFSALTDLLQESCVGLHTMWNEHFGISVVELQAAGLVTVAHNSGGPKMDIVVPLDDCPTGLLASDEDTYSASLYEALTMSDPTRRSMQEAARRSAHRFTDENFEREFRVAIDEVLAPVDSE